MFPDKIKRYRKGDRCPCCGQPIQTDDPFTLGLISGMAALMGLEPEPAEIKPALTENEKVELAQLYIRGYNFLARDSDGGLFAYAAYPMRTARSWAPRGDGFTEVNGAFAAVPRNSPIPSSIKELLAM